MLLTDVSNTPVVHRALSHRPRPPQGALSRLLMESMKLMGRLEHLWVSRAYILKDKYCAELQESCTFTGLVMFWPWLGLKAKALARFCLALACSNARPGQPLWLWPGLGLALA